MPQPLDAEAVRRWCQIALDSLGRAREDIDAINVYPVPDGDTGTNLYLTVESAAQAVTQAVTQALTEAAPGHRPAAPTLAQAARAMAHGALIGARGNSGTILAQLLRGMAEEFARHPEPAGPAALRQALRQAAKAAYEAVARPVEGTMLTVARAAADAARANGRDHAPTAAVAASALAGAEAALARTPGQLPVLADAGVVDAGGSGLVAVLGALDAALSGRAPDLATRHALGRAPGHARPSTPRPAPAAGQTDHAPGNSPGYEVVYLLDAPEAALPALRERLEVLGDSLVVGGGEGLWQIHVHTPRPGAAVEAGVAAGRPHRIRITWLAAGPPHTAAREGRAVIAVLPGDGLAGLCREAGATTLTARPGQPPGSGGIAAAIRDAGAREAVLLPNDESLWHAAAAAAEQVRAEGIRVAVIPTRSPVQGLAALAVHAPERRFDEDVVAMTSAAGATRFGEVALAERESWTMAGICQAGDVLGLIEGDVAVIGDDTAQVAGEVLTRMLSAGGELVTLVLGAGAPPGLAARLEEQLRRGHLGVETVVCEGRQNAHLLIGVE